MNILILICLVNRGHAAFNTIALWTVGQLHTNVPWCTLYDDKDVDTSQVSFMHIIIVICMSIAI